jgi:hypothetical protein
MFLLMPDLLYDILSVIIIQITGKQNGAIFQQVEPILLFLLLLCLWSVCGAFALTINQTESRRQRQSPAAFLLAFKRGQNGKNTGYQH